MKFLVAVIAIMLFLPLSAYAQLSQTEIVNASFGGPVFLDAFWTNRITAPPAGTSLEKVEVGSGDGTSVLAVTLVNRGFSDITGVTGYLTLPAGLKVAGAGSGPAAATHNSIVSAGSTFTLFFQVEITNSASAKGYTAPLRVEYSRTLEAGATRAADITVPFKVTGKILLDAASRGGVEPGASSKVAIEITNTGSAPATGVVVTVPGSSGVNPTTQQASIVALGQKTFELGAIPPGGSATIEPVLYASSASGETLQTVVLQVSYGNAYGERKTTSVPVGLVVLPESASSLVSVVPVGESSMITAGKITDLRVSLANNREEELSDVVVSLNSQSDSIKILGRTSWTVGDMAASSSQELSTKVFAAEDMIGKAATFVFTIQHLSGGQPEIETVELGAYVDGEIAVTAYDISVTYIGGRPNITGNLLNEGNVLALFTTVELVSAENLVDSLPPQQYLGDLAENSPLPFSIPVRVQETAGAGTYSVELRVHYKDGLRESHVLEIMANVDFVPEVTSTNGQNANAAGTTPAIAGGAVAAVAIVFVVIRARKKAKLKHKLQFSKQNGGQDIESVLDTHLSKPEEGK